MQEEYRMLRDVSRTFALSIEGLPQSLRDAITIAYLLLRVSDGLEDHEEMAADRKSYLLRLWADVLAGKSTPEKLTREVTDLDGLDPEVHVVQNADMIVDRLHRLPAPAREPITERVHRSTLGMARWQDHGPYVEDEDALDDYMHEVAGRVGYLVTDLFAWYSPAVAERKDELMPLSRECGLALQTVNVLRGIPKDYERGWVFVPVSYYEPLGLTRDTLLAPENAKLTLQVVNRLAVKADRHLQHGLTYVSAFPRRLHNVRLSLMWPLFFAVRTLAVSRNNAAVLFDEAKISRDEIKKIIYHTKLMGWSNQWLARYYDRLAQPPKELDRSPSMLLTSAS